MRCIRCSHEIPAGYNVCPNCGRQLGGGYVTPPEGQMSRNGSEARWSVTSVFSIVGAVIVAVFTFIPTWIHIKVLDFDFYDYWDYGDYSVSSSEYLGLFSHPRDRSLRDYLFSTPVKVMAILLMITALILILKIIIKNSGVQEQALMKATAGMDCYLPVILLLFFLGISRDYALNFGMMIGNEFDTNIQFSFSWWFVLIGVIFTLIHPFIKMIRFFQKSEGLRK